MIRSAIESWTTCTNNKEFLIVCKQRDRANDAVATHCVVKLYAVSTIEIEIIMKMILCILVTVQCIILVSSVPTTRDKRELPCTHPLRLSLPELFTHCDTAPCTYGDWSSWERVPGKNFSNVSQSLCESGKAYTEERTRPTTGSGCNQTVRETRRIICKYNSYYY